MIDLTTKRILITGAHGFLGRHLVAHLRALGCANLSLPEHRHYDLTSQPDIRRLLEMERPEIVIHLAAAVGGIGANRARPADFFYQNAIMGVQLIEECRLASVSKLVLLGTVCGYPKMCRVPFKEDDFWGGYPEPTNAPYGLAKKMLLVAAAAYRDQYNLNSIYLIPVNLYGPGDNFDLATSHVIPALVRKFVDARKQAAASVTLWGTGRATREFLYAPDAARAIALATARYDGGLPVNIGSGQEITIADLASKIAAMAGFSGQIVYDGSMPDGQPHRCLDVFRAQSLFNFKATTLLDDGLRETIARYENDATRLK